MAQDNSFDIVSKVDIQEARNAIDQAIKEIRQRFDLKDSHSEVNLEGNDIQLASANEYKLEAVKDILCQKLVKRGVSLKNLSYGKIEPAAGQSVRQKISLQQGIPVEKAKEIVRLVKDSKKKAQVSIQGDSVRISSKDRDELQAIIAMLRGKDLGLELQFTNYRTEGERIQQGPLRLWSRVLHFIQCRICSKSGFAFLRSRHLSDSRAGFISRMKPFGKLSVRLMMPTWVGASINIALRGRVRARAVAAEC